MHLLFFYGLYVRGYGNGISKEKKGKNSAHTYMSLTYWRQRAGKVLCVCRSVITPSAINLGETMVVLEVAPIAIIYVINNMSIINTKSVKGRKITCASLKRK